MDLFDFDLGGCSLWFDLTFWFVFMWSWFYVWFDLICCCLGCFVYLLPVCDLTKLICYVRCFGVLLFFGFGVADCVGVLLFITYFGLFCVGLMFYFLWWCVLYCALFGFEFTFVIACISFCFWGILFAAIVLEFCSGRLSGCEFVWCLYVIGYFMFWVCILVVLL